MWQFCQRDRSSGPAGIEFRQAPHEGRSVFAGRPFRRGEIIEVSPFLKLAAAEKEAIITTSLYNYYFLLSEHSEEIAVGLGYTALYNHSATPNAVCGIRVKKGLVQLQAARDIAAGREITINYNGNPNDPAPVYPAQKEYFKEPFSSHIEYSHLYIAESLNKGRGVFTNRVIAKGDLIEICPYVHFSAAEDACLSATRLTDYTFAIDMSVGTSALALGFGSLYNHAQRPNAAYYSDSENRYLLFYAEEDIPPRHEICINYGGNSMEEGAAWFASRNLVCESDQPP